MPRVYYRVTHVHALNPALAEVREPSLTVLIDNTVERSNARTLIAPDVEVHSRYMRRIKDNT